MFSVKTRRFAVPVVVACAGVLGSCATAHAAGGLSITPAVLEHSAKRRNRRHDVAQQLHQRVAARDGHGAPVAPGAQRHRDRRLAQHLSKYVRATTRTFTIRAGAKRPLTLKLYHVPHGGSLYGGVDIFGKPTHTKGRKGIIPQYRIISKLRLNASTSYNWRTGAARSAARGHPAGPQPRQLDRPDRRHLQHHRPVGPLGHDEGDRRAVPAS